MDIFVFQNPTAPMRMQQGILIEDTISKTWIERYRNAGEFKIVAEASSGILEKMPKGSFVSHTNTSEIMIIEDHEINDDYDTESVVTVSGRSFETILDYRVVGANKTWPSTGALEDFTLIPNQAWAQARNLIRHHILAEFLVDPSDVLAFIEVISTDADPFQFDERVIPRGSLYNEALSILALDDLGIKSVRPGPWSMVANPVNTALVIHRGVDRSQTASFSWDAGDIESADYLWSTRSMRDCALVTGRWVDTLVDSTNNGINRRMIHVDASDLDQHLTAAPTGTARTTIVNRMKARGAQVISAHREVALLKADISKSGTAAKYRSDYEVGDYVSISGDYNEMSVKRVIEYAEIEDENGYIGFPTFE